MESNTIDRILYIVAIIIMISAVGLLLHESKKCKNPIHSVMEQISEDENLTYQYATISFYDGKNSLPYVSYTLNSDGKLIPPEFLLDVSGLQK